jgi:hypothetical protein
LIKSVLAPFELISANPLPAFMLIVPRTDSAVVGLFIPIPTFPLCKTDRPPAPATFIPPANVEVAAVSVAVRYPIVGDEVAPTAPVEVQYVRVFGEPEPVSEEPRLRQVPEMAKQPAVMLKPLAAVVEPVLEMVKRVVVALAAVVDEMKKRFVFVSAEFAEMANFANGEVEPTPTLPFLKISNFVEYVWSDVPEVVASGAWKMRLPPTVEAPVPFPA